MWRNTRTNLVKRFSEIFIFDWPNLHVYTIAVDLLFMLSKQGEENYNNIKKFLNT